MLVPVDVGIIVIVIDNRDVFISHSNDIEECNEDDVDDSEKEGGDVEPFESDWASKTVREPVAREDGHCKGDGDNGKTDAFVQNVRKASRRSLFPILRSVRFLQSMLKIAGIHWNTIYYINATGELRGSFKDQFQSF